MKKFIISLLFITGFTTDIIYQRFSGSGQTLLTGQPVLTSNNPIILPSNNQLTSQVPNQIVNQTSGQTFNQMPLMSGRMMAMAKSKYRDGSYIGQAADATYGTVQVKATVFSGKITAVDFLSYPNNRQHSVQVSGYALPILKQEAISTQSAQVDAVSGASYTSAAFIESLQSALTQAN